MISGVHGDLFVFASSVHLEPSEADNQGAFQNEYKLIFFQTMTKVSFMTETPPLSAVSQYGKYSIPHLFLAFEASDPSPQFKISVLFGFDALKKPEEVLKAEEEARVKADALRINKRRIKDSKKPKGKVEAGPDKLQQSKTGGAIWRAEFLTALKEAQGDRPLSTTGNVLHALSSDAEFEEYFRPMMTAYSKWVIEYNVAQLIQKEDYLPRFFKLIKGYRTHLKDYRLEKMKKNMNLTIQKNFLVSNIDDQSDFPLMWQQRLDDRARELDDKIREVNQRKGELEEKHRERINQFSKRWEQFKIQMAEQKEIDRQREARELRKRTWIVMMTVRRVMRDEFYSKYKQVSDSVKHCKDVIRVTKGLVRALKRIVRLRGKDLETRLYHQLRHSFMSSMMTFMPGSE